MDKLEQRLSQLKSSYEEIPTTSNPAKIMEQIKKTEKKRKKKWVAQLPYVASFIGVLIIGSLLAVQLLSSQETNTGDGVEKNPEEKPPVTSEQKETDEQKKETEQNVTEEQIAEKHKILVAYYDELLSTSYEHPIVQIEDVESLSYIKEAKELVENVGSPQYRNYKDEQDLEQSFEEYMTFIKNRFEMPKTDIEQLKESKKDDLSSEVMDIIRKQEELKVYFQNQLISFSKSGELTKLSQDFFEQQNKLLSVKGIENHELEAFAQYLKDNGFTLIDLEGMHEVEIDFQALYEASGAKLNDSVIVFIDTKKNRIVTDGHLQGNWNTVADRIALLESIRSNFEGSSKVVIDQEIAFYMNIYINGAEYPRPYLEDGTLDPELKASYMKFLEERDSNTESYKKVEEHYKALEKRNFQKSTNE
ncbi:hypothetical protein FZW96_18710 [Bacillus sp. BGMRC 2118]|nr:hypothetical protein FZW96_18710 [Bacillus sp. BGMRC 2118]